MLKENSVLDKVLRVYAPAKINLHLEVLGIRDDGFHEVAMLMQSIDLTDQLEIKKRTDGQITLSTDDQTLSTNEDNLIVKAAKLLSQKVEGSVPGADIYLRKRIPIGAGLAGGSSDGVATLVGLNTLWKLGFSEKELEAFSAELGSDMPFCLKGGAQLCFGRGERLEPIKVHDSPMAVLLIKDPNVTVSTPWAYKRYKDLNASRYMNTEYEFDQRRKAIREEILQQSSSFNNSYVLRNDLQAVVEGEIKAVKNSLKVLNSLPGNIGVAMSGSGPSCFALYSNIDKANEVFEQYLTSIQSHGLDCWCCPLRSGGVSFDK